MKARKPSRIKGSRVFHFGGISRARTYDLHDVNAIKRVLGVFYTTRQSLKSEENQGVVTFGDFSCFWCWGASWGSGWGRKLIHVS
jgi:hypothetical protein